MGSVHLTPLKAWLLARLIEKPAIITVRAAVTRLEVFLNLQDGLSVPHGPVVDLIQCRFLRVEAGLVIVTDQGRQHAMMFPAQMAVAKAPVSWSRRDKSGKGGLVNLVA